VFLNVENIEMFETTKTTQMKHHKNSDYFRSTHPWLSFGFIPD
jgi:hypothetical protein